MSASFQKADLRARPGEQLVKEWVAERAAEAGVAPNTIRNRMSRAAMRWPEVTRRVNARVIFVRKEGV